MRVNKFRCWCKNKNQWESDPWVMDENGNIIDFNKKVRLNQDAHIVTQFIGIKDLNDKEIYEGDIVDYECKLYYGGGDVGIGVIVYNFSNSMFVIKCFVNPTTSIAKVIHDFRLKVIGNIYENPELMKIESENNGV